MSEVVVPDIENHLDDPDEKGVPDLWDTKLLKCYKIWHHQLADGTIHRHSEVINFKGCVYQERLDSDFDVYYLNDKINKQQYELFEKEIENMKTEQAYKKTITAFDSLIDKLLVFTYILAGITTVYATYLFKIGDILSAIFHVAITILLLVVAKEPK